jgi:hypothetical protein
MNAPDQQQLRAKLMALIVEHRDLDAAINALSSDNAFDQIQIQRLKKRKLRLRDEISKIEDMLVPDIIA